MVKTNGQILYEHYNKDKEWFPPYHLIVQGERDTFESLAKTHWLFQKATSSENDS